MRFSPCIFAILVASTSAFAPLRPILLRDARSSSPSTADSRTTNSRQLISPSELQALPDMVGAMGSASAASSAITSSPLFEYFLQTVISYAVPTFFTLVTIFFAASAFRKREGADFSAINSETAISELYNDLYGEGKPPRGGFGFNGGRLNKTQRRNLGIPESEYLKITNVNERYDSYDFSLRKATKSKAYAASKYRSRSFDRALAVGMAAGDELPAYAKSMLLEAEKVFLTKGKALISEIQAIETRLAGATIDKELQRLGMKAFNVEPEDIIDAQVESSNTTLAANNAEGSPKFAFMKKDGKSELLQSISKLQRESKQVELDFLQQVVAAVGTKRGLGIRAALLGDIAGRGSAGLLNQIEERPLSSILSSFDTEVPKSLFVMRFPGDVQASQLNQLREEVTAIIRNHKPGDEAMVVLQSGGGTVTGYGLAAGQLVRLQEAGLFLTMAVEQVAASGGYMMACVADRIVASPFAVLGSIGVISEIPNAYERLKQEGIEFQTVTAGKFKRTLTPTKKITKADIDKSKEELEKVLGQFSGFVKKNRPSLDIEAVATGETWFGEAALERGLCDEIKTVDDILLDYVDLGYNVYEVTYSPPQAAPEGLAQFFPAGADDGSLVRRGIRWAVGTFAEEVRSALDEKNSVSQRYMATDDTSNRVQAKE